jgi:outer membrane lipoprotein-sorting protein
MKPKSLIFLLALAVSVAARAQSADEIIAKYHENTGGVQKWKAMQTKIMVGKMTMQGMDLDMALTLKIPNKQHMKISFQGQDIVQAYDGKDAWAINPMMGGKDPVKLPAEQAKEMTDRELQDDFLDYKAKGHEVKLLGKETIDGTPCFKLELVKNKNNPKDDVTEIYYFDAQNYVPIMVSTTVAAGPAKGQEVKNYMGDYQDVDGLMLPFVLETKLNGQTVQKMTFEKISLNKPVDDALFAFPKK